MKLATLSTEQNQLLERFSKAGGVADFILFECDEDTSNYETHCKAVILGFKELQRRYAADARENFFQIKIDEDAAQSLLPVQISWKEFLGTRYDYERQGLIVNGKGDFWNSFFFYSDPAKRINIIPDVNVDDGIGTGFAYAFSSQPHGMRYSAEDLGEFFDKFLNVIVCRSEDSIIYQWPTNWSNYFEAGDEWWGSFLWSLSNPDSNQIVVITASTTD